MKFAILKVPKIWNVARHVSTEADAGSDGEEGEETTATKVQTKQHLVEQAAIWVCSSGTEAELLHLPCCRILGWSAAQLGTRGSLGLHLFA